MRHRDHAGFAHRGMSHERVLKIYGANPLAAGLDHVFAALHELDAAVRIDGGHVASAKPAVFGPAILRSGSGKVVSCHTGAADFQFAHGFSIPRLNPLVA